MWMVCVFVLVLGFQVKPQEEEIMYKLRCGSYIHHITELLHGGLFPKKEVRNFVDL